ncbi:MAG: imidazolonepropionase [Elusimicrobia bacterium]|nr:imidazolonepropionase [Elusimicrobiota bacterium]
MRETPLLLTDIPQLLTFAGGAKPRAGKAMRETGLVKDGAVLMRDGVILASGPRREIQRLPAARKARKLEAGGVVMPAFCDCHTHPVFAAPRLNDFAMRVGGSSYADIKKAGGGIVSSVRGVRESSVEELAGFAAANFARMLRCGTAAIEAKSGYGLSLEAELKSLRAIARAAQDVPVDVAPTLLAAHAVPPEFGGDAAKYVDFVIEKIIPAVAREKLAVFADVFCEKGYFSPEQSARIMKAAAKAGLKPKFHAEQMNRTGGALAAAAAKAVSADHLDMADASDIAALKRAGTIAVLLPASNCFLGLPYPPARTMIDAGLPVALATDFNPGTSPCWNMQLVAALACTQMRMTPEEALCAATVNGAFAMGFGGRAGTIQKGRQADLLVLRARDYREAVYYFGDNLCSMVFKRGVAAWNAAA